MVEKPHRLKFEEMSKVLGAPGLNMILINTSM